MAFSDKQSSLKQYDVFNGDADGICALHQYRLANPAPDAVLVTGVKRDIKLLDYIRETEPCRIAVFDVSMDSNCDSLQRLLASGNEIVYFDHHFSGSIPDSPYLSHHIDPAPDTCTSLIVDQLLGGRYKRWAICGAFGDNLHGVATAAASALSLKEADIIRLREIGELLNYNGYGAHLQDLYFPPDSLYSEVREYKDPLSFYEQSSVLETLRLGFENDMSQALSQPIFDETHNNRIYRFPDSPWARRVMGEFANLRARENPAGAHALITENSDGSLRISVRAPLDNRTNADVLCRSFPTGGGRSAAAGINALPTEQLGSFTKLFNEIYH